MDLELYSFGKYLQVPILKSVRECNIYFSRVIPHFIRATCS